jgi:putative salt-induced outer membrane protein YdiY
LRSIICVLVLLISLAATAFADVVTLKNGDRVTGTLVTVKGGNLELKSDILGDLTVPMAQVTSFSATKPTVVVVKGQAPIQGQLELDPSGNWKVTSNGNVQTVPAAGADLIMPAEAFSALEKTATPWQDWKGSASLGYSLQRGDQDTSSFATSVNAVRERPATPIFERHWRTDYTLTTLLSSATETTTATTGTTPTTESVTSRTFSTNLRQDYLFTPDNFVFGFVQFDHVGAQGLYLRQTYGGGYGHDLIKTARTNFSLLGGITYVHEKFFTGVYDSSPQALAGEKLGIQITKRVRLDHDVNFYPDLSHGGQYRFDTATTLSAKLSGKFSLNTGIIDLYLSNPATGAMKNNVNFTTGIGYTF